MRGIRGYIRQLILNVCNRVKTWMKGFSNEQDIPQVYKMDIQQSRKPKWYPDPPIVEPATQMKGRVLDSAPAEAGTKP